MNVIALLELILAHILSDFFFQWETMVKEKRKCNLKYVFGHALIHAATAYIIVHDFQNWVLPLVVFVSHALIDYVKYRFEDNWKIFTIDQIVHLLVIIGVWVYWYCPDFELCREVMGVDKLMTKKLLIIAIAFGVVLKPTSICITYFISKWAPEVSENWGSENEPSEIVSSEGKPMSNRKNGLKYAGEWIGYFERSLIVFFVITGYFDAVGFLLAAKSVFRYGDLKKKDEISITEYVLLGTLASFSSAIFVGFVVKSLI
ncbi:MAG: DUF3307 domain-containing protein [Paludibacteraceae bacterium]|nr:DUF3307 domain-containing protein [Paludibacteraceae bacterium]